MEIGDHKEVPDDASEHCPGTQSEDAGKSDACAGCPNQEACASAPPNGHPDPNLVAVAERMATVKHKILILSGKGGVGKSTFAAQLSFALADMDYQVGLLDIDICGPSIPKMLGLEGQTIHQSNLGWSPVYVLHRSHVSRVLAPPPDADVTWRGPRKNGLIKQFLKEVYWGELDFLVVDTPPGTSDEHISIVQFLKETGIDGAIIVTTPQQVSLIDVRKEVSFCKRVGIRVLGVVENMSGLSQPVSDFKYLKRAKTRREEPEDVTERVLAVLREKAPELLGLVALTEVFDSTGGGAAKMCVEKGVPFLGKVPLDLQLCKAAEEGKSYFDRDECWISASALSAIINKLLKDNVMA